MQNDDEQSPVVFMGFVDIAPKMDYWCMSGPSTIQPRATNTYHMKCEVKEDKRYKKRK